MAVLTIASFISKWGVGKFPSNGLREVTGEVMREFRQDIADSFSSVLGATAITAWKDPVIVATTANITLSGEQTIDGVLTSSSRVLVKNQSTQSQNGIYVSAAGAWTRATDSDSDAEVEGAAVGVTQGTVGQNSIWLQTTDGVTLGTSSLVYQQQGFGVSSQDLNEVLATGNDGGGLQIKNIADPTLAQDAATKAWVEAQIAASPVLQSVTKVITTAEILTGFSVPVTVLAAQGAGTIIQVMSPIMYKFTFGTAAFATNTGSQLFYNNASFGLHASGSLLASGSNRYQFNPIQQMDLPSTQAENTPIKWGVLAGNPTAGGTSTLTIHFKYIVLTL
jgi:hypothetical protein